MTIAISTEGLGKQYRLGELDPYGALRDVIGNAIRAPRRWISREGRIKKDPESIWAVRDLSFEVNSGEVVGIIGRNGAGKSTLLKLLSRITQPTEGGADVYGRVGSLLEVGTGFHPELTGRENTYLNGAVLGMGRAEINRKFDEIIDFAGVEKFIDTPVKRYSSGMQVRLAFAIAAHLEPEILLVDEVLAVGDAEFQRKCLGRMEEVSSEGRTVLFISHSMPAVLRLCPRVILLDGGKLTADGPAREAIKVYMESGLGTSAAREWSVLESAPGDDVARLKAVRVLNPAADVSEEVDIRDPVVIEVDYWLRQPADGPGPGVALSFWNDDGVMLFASTNLTNPKLYDRAQPGVIRAHCRIPGNLLAEGEILVHVFLMSQSPLAYHAAEADAVAFHVVDRSIGDGVRGKVVADWPGALRPRLDWVTRSLLDAQFPSGR
jgi:lipopolysaccharide transport system ATP-binding protein